MTAYRSLRLHRLTCQRVLALTIPVLLAGVMSGTGPARAAVGASGSQAAAAQGHVLGWGLNEFGELGVGDTMDRTTPVQVNGRFGLRASSARIGDFLIAVNSAGQVFTSGSGTDGELGTGRFVDHSWRPVKARLPRGVRVRSAREGFHFAVAVSAAGRVLAWGVGGLGQLGNGQLRNRNAPVYVQLPRGVKVTAVSAFNEGAIALTSTGRVLAWGYNFDGELGDGRKSDSRLPVWVSLARNTKVTSIAAGAFQLFAVTSTGGLLAWGDNNAGQLGIGHAGGLSRIPVRVHLPRGVKVVSASAGQAHSLALTSTGRVLAWGDNSQGQLGTGNRQDASAPVWVRLPKVAHITSIAAGQYHSLALTRGGKMIGWGGDGYGQMGDGGFDDFLTPATLFVPASKVLAIGAGPLADDSVAVVDQLIS
jgi:alpha-tubulin suppressor-like RCC1 family protein